MTTASETLQPFLLGGKAAPEGKHSESFTIVNPIDGVSAVGHCRRLTEADLPELYTSTLNCQMRWEKTTLHERAQVLTTLGQKLDHHKDPLARLMVSESGKPLKLALVEVDRAITLCRSFAQWLPWQPTVLPLEQEGKFVYIKRVPIGPILAITPFNFPLNLVIHKLAPAIATGNSIVIKPASQTSLTALYLGRLAIESGYDAISVVPASTKVAEQLVQSEIFRKLSFTGSSTIGWRLKQLSPKASVSLELGGNAACIIEPPLSLPMSEVASRCAASAFSYAGQVCISLQRIFVHHRLYDEFLAALVRETRMLQVGDPMDPRTDVGPMISLEDIHRSRQLIKDAVQGGANVVYGGSTYNTFTMHPTILNRTTPAMTVNRQEVFAPVVTVTPYEDFNEALELVNDSQYGLQAGIFSSKAEQIRQAFETLMVGGILINDVPSRRIDGLPYGGMKESGLGREGIMSTMESFTTPKTLISDVPLM